MLSVTSLGYHSHVYRSPSSVAQTLVMSASLREEPVLSDLCNPFTTQLDGQVTGILQMSECKHTHVCRIKQLPCNHDRPHRHRLPKIATALLLKQKAKLVQASPLTLNSDEGHIKFMADTQILLQNTHYFFQDP